MNSWLQTLRMRLVGGSLLARTVVTVLAFTMTTCLLLTVFSVAAIGATRALTGAPADAEVAADAADGEGADEAPGSKAVAKGAPRGGASKATGGGAAGSKARARAARRPGGAVAPADVLSGDAEEGS